MVTTELVAQKIGIIQDVEGEGILGGNGVWERQWRGVVWVVSWRYEGIGECWVLVFRKNQELLCDNPGVEACR